MKVSDYVIAFLRQQGVAHIFEMTGGAIVHLLDSTYERNDIDCISVHHEQAAAFAAEGYSRINGKLGVAMGTSGPGALNLLTGIGSCYFDSVPCLFITGQVNTYEYKFDKPVRQIGFQETDIVRIVKPIVKFTEMITEASQIRYCLEKAVFVAQHGRPGPVLIDIPMNIQREQIEPDTLASFFDSEECKEYKDFMQPSKPEHIVQTIQMLEQAERPIILVGGGVRAANAVDELRQFVELSGVPVVSSLLGIDVLPAAHPMSTGLIGSYGNRYSNLAIANCDFLLILGSRLDTRQTGTKPETFARAAKKVHVDVEEVEKHGKVRADLTIHSDVKVFLADLHAALLGTTLPDYSAWHAAIARYKDKFPSGSPVSDEATIEPNRFMELLSSRCGEDDIIVLDVGQHQMWASQSFRLREGQRLLNAGGMGAMGFALPAAIGAVMMAPHRQVIVIAGDGGIQVNIQELHTIAHLGLPIKIFVMNNQSLGMVRQFQDMYFDGRQQSTVRGYGCPDLVKVAAAYRIPALRIQTNTEALAHIDIALQTKGSFLVEVQLETNTTVNPKLMVDKPIEDMFPFLEREQLKAEMIIELLEDASDTKR